MKKTKKQKTIKNKQTNKQTKKKTNKQRNLKFKQTRIP